MIDLSNVPTEDLKRELRKRRRSERESKAYKDRKFRCCLNCKYYTQMKIGDEYFKSCDKKSIKTLSAGHKACQMFENKHKG